MALDQSSPKRVLNRQVIDEIDFYGPSDPQSLADEIDEVARHRKPTVHHRLPGLAVAAYIRLFEDGDFQPGIPESKDWDTFTQTVTDFEVREYIDSIKSNKPWRQIIDKFRDLSNEMRYEKEGYVRWTIRYQSGRGGAYNRAKVEVFRKSDDSSKKDYEHREDGCHSVSYAETRFKLPILVRSFADPMTANRFRFIFCNFVPTAFIALCTIIFGIFKLASSLSILSLWNVSPDAIRLIAHASVHLLGTSLILAVFFCVPVSIAFTKFSTRSSLRFALYEKDEFMSYLFRKTANNERIITLSTFETTCPVCMSQGLNSKVHASPSIPFFGVRMIGRCTEYPTHHRFSFDPVTLRGKPID